MSGLVLKLAAGERVMINGAVVESVDRRSRIAVLTPNTRVLRLRDALSPEDVHTPARRVYYLAQLIVTGEAAGDETAIQLRRGLEQLGQVFRDPDSRVALLEAVAAIDRGEAYTVLKSLRPILRVEEQMLARMN